MRVLVTGSAGFVGGYVVEELLLRGHQVIGLDNLSKYGNVSKSYDNHPSYVFVKGDASDPSQVERLLENCDHLIAGAAIVGGVPFLRSHCYDLLSANERISFATCDAAIKVHEWGRLQKVTWISSSMVFEGAGEDKLPSREGDTEKIPPPISSYGLQKLAIEYMAQAAWEQYGLPYTIIRPFNCVGAGERRALDAEEVTSGNIRLAMSHVIPDLVQKVLKGQDPLHILGSGEQVRHFTYGGDLAEGIVTAMEHPAATNQDFNISSPHCLSINVLAELIWRKIKGPEPLTIVHDDPYPYDIQKQMTFTNKALQLLGFQADTPIDKILDEVIAWTSELLERGEI